VVSHAYPGDRPDVTQFAGVIDTLVARHQGLRAAVESLTVVHDAGQNSTGNHAVVEAAGIGFVSSLPPSDHADLLALPRSRYGVVEEARYPGLRCLDTTVTALGTTIADRQARIVIAHSLGTVVTYEALHAHPSWR
jgi:hypothetical protein